MGGADRLSGLSDDLLASVISSLPTREAVRTAALSRRWRPVWLRTYSLILDTMSYGDLSDDIWAYMGRQEDGTQDRLLDACQFLDATGRCRHVRNLSLTVHGRDKEYFEDVMGWSSRDTYDLMASLLGSSALRYLEEVRVKFGIVKSPSHCNREKKLTGWVYKLDPAALPKDTLRVLDLDNCRLESPPGRAAVSFPRLSSLRLYKCSSSMDDLEGWIRAAPGLCSAHIQDHNFSQSGRFALESTSLAALTLVPSLSCTTRDHFELDVPRLRAFQYNGAFEAFSMKSHTAKLERVDLAVSRALHENGEDREIWFPRFWQFLRNFRHVKGIKLKVPNIEGIAAVDKHTRQDHLFTLPCLEKLELRGSSDPGRRDDAALAIANLHQCCPALQDLRIRIPTDPYRPYYAGRSPEVRVVSGFDVSMGVFRRRFSNEMVTLMLDPDDGRSSHGSVLPGLTGCRFRCLDSHLKNVMLQFELKDLNSFEVCLAKFFAENCMVLEALQIDDGKHNFLSRINWMVQAWRANAAKQRNHMECDDSVGSSKQIF